MKFIKYLITFLILFPTLARANWEYDSYGSIVGAYGFMDTSSDYPKHKDNNSGWGRGEINNSAIYSFNEDASLSFHLDLMLGLDRELQTYNQGRWGEEAYAIFDSSYGRIMLGQTFNVGAQFYEGASMVGVFQNNNDIADFIHNPNWRRNSKQTKFATLNAAYINTDGVAPKITYVSPEIQGTAIGFSYVPDSYNRRGLINNHANYSSKDGYIAAIYSNQEYKGLDINATAAFAEFHDDDKEFSASLQLEYGNWTLGGGWRKTYIEGKDNLQKYDSRLPEFFDGYREGEAWDLGLKYQIGPYEGGISYFSSKAENSSNQDKVLSFSNQYQIDKNFDAYFAVAYVDFSGNNDYAPDNNKGYAFVGGIGFNF